MLTAAAVCAAIYLYRLSVAILFFAFRPDMAQFPSVMADVIVFVLKDGVCHVVILRDVFFIRPCLSFLMILQPDIAIFFFFKG